jgi:outer membrane biosynthesis protein TonB
MKSRIKMKPVLTLFILLCAWVLTSAANAATNQGTEPNKCSTVGFAELSGKDMRSRLKHTQSIDPPCCGRNLDLKGTIVLLVVVGETGDVTCIELVSGDPMIVNSAIHSVATWKFQPQVAKGQSRAFYGRLSIKFHATEQAVTFKVTTEPSKVQSTPTTH